MVFRSSQEHQRLGSKQRRPKRANPIVLSDDDSKDIDPSEADDIIQQVESIHDDDNADDDDFTNTTTKTKPNKTTKKRARYYSQPQSLSEPSEDVIEQPSSDSSYHSDDEKTYETTQQLIPSDIWASEYKNNHNETSTKSLLLISSRKFNQLEQWLQNALINKGPRFLILGGPPGCGKTTAIRYLTKLKKCEMSTWQAPQCLGTTSISQTLIQDLSSFIIGTRYTNLVIDKDEDGHQNNHIKKKKVLVIDDLPISFMDNWKFQDDLRDLMNHAAKFTPHPVCLILSDSPRGIARTTRMLLGLDFQHLNQVISINIPAVTDHVMRKRLREFVQKKKILLSSRALEDIITCSHGDFRAALNSLQFCSVTTTTTTTTTRKKSKSSSLSLRHKTKRRRHDDHDDDVDNNNNSKNENDEMNLKMNSKSKFISNMVGADGTLGTYHAISKILNNKRETDGRSKYDAETILHEARAEPSSFVDFLHHNFPHFFGDNDDMVDALDILSMADTMFKWTSDDLNRTTMYECAASVVVRGFLHCNQHPIRAGWRPICGPQTRTIVTQAHEHIIMANREIYPMTQVHVPGVLDVCDLLPYVEVMRGGKTTHPWGITFEQGQIGKKINRDDGVADGADIAMVENENRVERMEKEEWGNVSIHEKQKDDFESIQQQNIVMSDDNGENVEAGEREFNEGLEEDIEDWDDD